MSVQRRMLLIAGILIFIAGCTAIDRESPASPSIDVRAAATLPSASGLMGGELQTSAESSVHGGQERQTPKGERAIGYLAMAGLILFLFLAAVVVRAVINL